MATRGKMIKKYLKSMEESKKLKIIDELKRIGESEINFSISYFYDSTWIFKLGDDLNGFIYEESFPSIEEGVEYLIQEIVKQYPNSDYIKKRGKKWRLEKDLMDYLKEVM